MSESLRWSSDIARVDDEAGVTLALLPNGPVLVLTGVDELLEHMVGEFTLDGLIGAVEAAGPEHAALVAAGVRNTVQGLRQAGLLVPVQR